MDVSASYDGNGYVIWRNAIAEAAIDAFERRVINLVTEWTGQSFETTRDPKFSSFLMAHRELERRLYDESQTYDWIMDLARSRDVTRRVSQLLGKQLGLMRKVVFRIDLPQVTRELAVWHQDYWYVRGNQRIVTAWIPLQDTAYVHGCLMIMPGSHRLGPIEHDGQALMKRHYPSGIFDREVRYVEMCCSIHCCCIPLESTCLIAPVYPFNLGIPAWMMRPIPPWARSFRSIRMSSNEVAGSGQSSIRGLGSVRADRSVV